jgi:hypothetical protein
MNTKEVADAIGTSARTLRQFLRSPSSTFVAVGSGARYEFTEDELPTLRKRFAEWSGNGKPKALSDRRKGTNGTPPVSRQRSTPSDRLQRDQEVWAEEGEVIVIPDIRDPRVRARVRAEAEAQEDRLNMLLMRAGLHITQLGDRR